MAAPSIPVAVGDYLRGRVWTYCGDQAANNVLYWKVADMQVGPTADLQALCNAINAALKDAYVPLMSQDANYRGLGLTNIRTGTVGSDPSIEVFSTAAVTPGTSLQAVLPRQVCGIISKRTVIGKRWGRGRMYVPFPSEEHSDVNGVVSNAYKANLDALASVCLSHMIVNVAGNLNVGLDAVLRTDNTPENPDDKMYTYLLITEYVSRKKWGTQRRRGDYGLGNVAPW